MEGTEIHLCKDSGSKESGPDEKEKSWSGAHQLRQHADKVEWKSKMVGSLKRLEKLHEKTLKNYAEKFDRGCGHKKGKPTRGRRVFKVKLRRQGEKGQ